jgi:hypothetical protein
MSKSRSNRSIGKKRVKVVEVEEVETVDRRGNIRTTMQKVKQNRPTHKQSHLENKSPTTGSPVVHGSMHQFEKLRASKVCILFNYFIKCVACNSKI